MPDSVVMPVPEAPGGALPAPPPAPLPALRLAAIADDSPDSAAAAARRAPAAAAKAARWRARNCGAPSHHSGPILILIAASSSVCGVGRVAGEK